MSFLKLLSNHFLMGAHEGTKAGSDAEYLPEEGPLRLRVTVESPNCMLYGTPQVSLGSIFSGVFFLTVRDSDEYKSVDIRSVHIKLRQNISISPSLTLYNQITSRNHIKIIKNWDILKEPRKFLIGEYDEPFSCHIPGNLCASANVGSNLGLNISYEIFVNVKYKENSGGIVSRAYNFPLLITRIFSDLKDRTSFRTFEPSTTTVEAILPDTIYAGCSSPMRLIIEGINKDLRNKRWSVREIDCFVYEVVRMHTKYIPSEDEDMIQLKQLMKNTEEYHNTSFYDSNHYTNPTINTYLDIHDLSTVNKNLKQEYNIISEEIYQIYHYSVNKGWNLKFLKENNDVDITFKVNYKGLKDKVVTKFCPDIDDISNSGISVTHKVVLEITLFEEEISYERVPPRCPMKPSKPDINSTALEKFTSPSYLAPEIEQDEEEKEVETMKLYTDRTGMMQRLKTTYRQILSDRPPCDMGPWHDDIPPLYEDVKFNDPPPPDYIKSFNNQKLILEKQSSVESVAKLIKS